MDLTQRQMHSVALHAVPVGSTGNTNSSAARQKTGLFTSRVVCTLYDMYLACVVYPPPKLSRTYEITKLRITAWTPEASTIITSTDDQCTENRGDTRDFELWFAVATITSGLAILRLAACYAPNWVVDHMAVCHLLQPSRQQRHFGKVV